MTRFLGPSAPPPANNARQQALRLKETATPAVQEGIV